METAKKPKIRFKGFTNAWEQNKLSNLTTMHARIGWQNLRTSEFLDTGDYMLITGTDFVDGNINYSTCHYVKKERYMQDKNIQIKNGSILITKDGTLGKVAYVENLTMPATLNAGVFNVEIKNKNLFDEKYLYQYLKAPFLMDYVTKKATGGTIKHLNQNILIDFPVIAPSKKEQEKLGKCFSFIDELLTLHQRKCEKLQNIKKSLLEKMFPKNNEKFPAIRFKGFTNAWEQCKLNDIAEKVIEKNIYLRYKETFTNSAQFGIIPQQDFFDHSVSNIKNLGGYYIVKKDDFVYNPRISTLAPVGPINRNTLEEIGVMSPLYTVFRTNKVIPIFLEYYFKSSHWHLFMLLNGDSGARADRFSIKDEKFFELPVPFLHEREQIKIGKFLKQVDKLITLHQRQVEKLQNIKKALLEKMFV